MNPSPAELGYRMPAEWEPHEATWIAWPHQREDWPGKFAPIPWVYCEIVRNLSRFEDVNILIRSLGMKRRVSDQLAMAGANLKRVRFFKAATDRAWLRDSGPTFVIKSPTKTGESPEGTGASNPSPDPSPESATAKAEAPAAWLTEGDGNPPVLLIDWKFNAWAKYDNWKRDNHLPRKIASWLEFPRWTPRFEKDGRKQRVVMEGGAIDVNGRGTLLATEECLLSPVQARNPGLTREDVEQVLAENLGVRHIIWLGRGIVGDDTHGHVDDLARFVDPTTVVTVVERRESDPNFIQLRENLERLRSARDQDGNPLRVVELPMPAPVVFDSQWLPASYANFYIANGVVLVPTFNDPADREALNILAGLFPDREVVGIHCVDLVFGLGTLHCLTQQQPTVPGD
jgi:agmatine deiminase